jgi:hypothetical protein
MVAAIKVRRSCILENKQYNDQKTQTLLNLGVNSGAPLVAPVVFWIPFDIFKLFLLMKNVFVDTDKYKIASTMQIS